MSELKSIVPSAESITSEEIEELRALFGEQHTDWRGVAIIRGLMQHVRVMRSLCTSTWQPVDTAPKDEDVVLLYLEGSGVQPGYWEDGQWLACETLSLTGGKWHATPTHWMPLPEPPK